MNREYRDWNSGYGFVRLGAAEPVRTRLDKPVLWILSMLPDSELMDLYARIEGIELKDVSNWALDFGESERGLATEQMKKRIAEHVDRAHAELLAKES